MLSIVYQTQFKRDYQTAIKRGCDPNALQAVITMLASQQKLPNKYRDHALRDTKDYKVVRECHIEPDWLLIYKIYKDNLTLMLIRTGTHSDLF